MSDQIGTTKAHGEANAEAQSAFATTLVGTMEEKHTNLPHTDDSLKSDYLGNSSVDTAATYAKTDPIFASKAQLLNHALSDIGMKRYQWLLVLVTSMGWFLDQFWIFSFTAIGPAAANENQFFLVGNKLDYLYVSLYVGLTVGAAFWPLLSDLFGRRLIFTSTLVLMGLAGLVGAGMPEFTGLCIVGFVVGYAVAGNQATDAMILIESIPTSHHWLVSLQGLFWGFGQLVSALIGWTFIQTQTCGTGTVVTSGSLKDVLLARDGTAAASATCHYVSNKGWRYIWWTFGCITGFLYLCRLAFPLLETPRYLLSNRRYAEAAQAVKDIARLSHTSTWLTEAHFARIDSAMGAPVPDDHVRRGTLAMVISSFRVSTRLIVRSVGVRGIVTLLFLWTTMGLALPLFQAYVGDYLSTSVTAITPYSVTTSYLFRYYVYVALAIIPGPVIATLMVELKFLGRKFSGAIIAVICALMMYLTKTASSRSSFIVWECMISLTQYASLAVLYLYTVEVFATPIRGLGLALTGFIWRFFGLVAAIITVYAGSGSGDAPGFWFPGTLWIVSAIAWIALPQETVNLPIA